MLIISLILAGINEDMQLAQQALQKREYGKAIKMFNEIIASGNPPVTAYFFRGNAYEGQRHLEEAMKDYASALDKSSAATRNVQERAQQRLVELCVANCQLNCPKWLGEKFFNHQNIQTMNQQQVDRAEILAADPGSEGFEDKVQKFAAVCRRDPAIQLRVLSIQIQKGNFTKIKTQIDNLKQLFPNKKYDIQQLSELFQLLQYLTNEEYPELEKAARLLTSQNPDEPAFGTLVKLTKGLTDAFELFTKLTPSSQRLNAAELQNAVNQAQKLNGLPAKVFERLKKRLGQQIAGLFDVGEEEVRELDFKHTVQLVRGQVRTVECAVLLLQNKTADGCENEVKSAAGKYVKALVLALPLGGEVKRLASEFARGADVVPELEELDRRYAVIVQMLADANKARGDAFPNIEKFVAEVNQILDRVFALQQRAANPDYYKVLNVSRGADASAIKKAYFKLARVNHPDMIPKDAPEAQKKAMNRKFQTIAEAYDVLSDEQKKRQYDQNALGQEEKQQAQNLHAQRKERSKQMVDGETQQQQFGGQQFMNFQGGDPFQFFQQFGGFNFNFGDQQQQQQQGRGQRQQGGQRQQRQGGQQQQQRQQGGQRQRIIFNGQEFFI